MSAVNVPKHLLHLRRDGDFGVFSIRRYCPRPPLFTRGGRLQPAEHYVSIRASSFDSVSATEWNWIIKDALKLISMVTRFLCVCVLHSKVGCHSRSLNNSLYFSFFFIVLTPRCYTVRSGLVNSNNFWPTAALVWLDDASEILHSICSPALCLSASTTVSQPDIVLLVNYLPSNFADCCLPLQIDFSWDSLTEFLMFLLSTLLVFSALKKRSCFSLTLHLKLV